jgi:2-polyprenyl-3-methyl-5-hydroxy-6-metoxy-1,4-benzoquinol methylase
VTKRSPSAQEKYPDFLNDQRQFFDELITREWHTYQSPEWDKRRRFEVDCLFRLVSPRKILDVGCGCGFHDVLMAEKSGVEEVLGIDYSEKSVETANRMYAHRNVQRRVEDISQTAASGRYDLVVSFQVIEHLTDAAAFLQNCQRQAAPGGYLAVVTPNRLRLSNRLRILAGGQAQLGDPQHYREYVPAELIVLGNEQGLEYCGSFAYGISLRIPKTNLNLLPLPASLRLGHLFSPLAECFCVVFKRGTRQ